MPGPIKFGAGDTASGESDVPGAPSASSGTPRPPVDSGPPKPPQNNLLTPQLNVPILNNPSITNPSGLVGQERWQDQLKTIGLSPRSAQYDLWVLSLQPDANDTDYNNIISSEKAQAQKRQDLRKQVGPDLTPGDESQIEQGLVPTRATQPGNTKNSHDAAARQKYLDDTQNVNTHDAAGRAEAVKEQQASVANKRAENEDQTRGKPQGNTQQVIGIDGKPVQAPAATGTSNPNQSQSSAMVNGASPTQDVGKQVTNGDYVWVGGGVTGAPAYGQTLQTNSGAPIPKGGDQGGTVRNTDLYMSTDDAKEVIATWDPATIMKFQQAMGLKQTGLPDAKTFTAWGEMVDTAARLTAAGKKIDPLTVAMTYAAKAQPGSGGGGGGGGGGGASYQKSDVQALLTSVMQQEAGRDPTQAEVNQFYSFFTGQGDVANPSQVATSWVRTNLGGQVGSYQAATTYYQAMLSVLGASPVGGSGA